MTRSKALWLISLCWMICLLETAAAAPSPLFLCVIIGNNHSLMPGMITLRYADDDALRIGETFRRGNPTARVIVLVDPDEDTQKQYPGKHTPPTLANWKSTMAAVKKEIAAAHAEGRTVTLFFYFAGHGEQQWALHLADGLLPRKTFLEDLAHAHPDTIMALMDACFLGQGSSGGGKVVDPSALVTGLDLKTQPNNMGSIAPSDKTGEPGYLQGGLVTSIALTGLLGPADLDNNGRISFWELGKYIRTQLPHRDKDSKIQILNIQSNPLETVMDLRLLPETGIHLHYGLPECLIEILRTSNWQHMAVIDHNPMQTARLYLPPDTYEVRTVARPADWMPGDGYPSDRLRVKVTDKMVELSDMTAEEWERIYLLPPGRGIKTHRELDRTLVVMSEQEAAVREGYLNSKAAISLAPPLSAVSVRWLPAGQGPELTADSESRGQGVILQYTAFWQLRSWEHQFLGLGANLQYGIQHLTEAPLNAPETGTYLRQELRLGVSALGLLSLPSHTQELQATVSYAPWVVTRDGRLLAQGDDYYWRPATVTGELAVSMRFRITRRLELGPQLRGEVWLVNSALSHLATQTVPSAGLSLGLELRQRIWR